jgi:drug/metabolite transporter (DMT)-like permease
MSAALLPAAAAGFVSLILGGTVVVTRFMMFDLGPATLACLRATLATAVMLPFVLAFARARPSLREFAAIVALGFVQFAVFAWTVNKGLEYAPAARGAVIMSTAPAFTLGLAAALRYEAFTARKAAGVLATLAGVAVALGDEAGAMAEDWWIGDLALFVGAVASAVYAVLSRPYVQRFPPLFVTAVAMAGGAAALWPLALAEGALQAPARFGPAQWASLLYLAIPNGIVAYGLWNWALRRLTPTRVAVFLPLIPLSATLLGWAMLGEPVGPRFAAGLALVLLGVWLANSGRSG